VAVVGSGEFLDVMVEVDLQLLAGRPPRAVFLPTAAAEEGDATVQYWIDLGRSHFNRMGVEAVALPVLDRDDADRADLAAVLAGAGLVYLSGGNPGYLAATLRGTRVWEAITASWRAGSALAGCSAGACALTWLAEDVRARQARGVSASGEQAAPMDAHGAGPSGLALLPSLAVIPHYDRIVEWVPGITEEFLARVPAGVTVVGVDEETAMIASPDASGALSYRVAGRQSVWVVGRDGNKTEHSAPDVISSLTG
jgi:cyanophycinase